MATSTPVLICAADTLKNGQRAQRFTAEGRAAFVIRYRDRVYAYLNQCRHIPVELDLREGDVFDLTGHYLICAMHGACFQPENGQCVSGPCAGQALHSITVFEHQGNVYYQPTENQ